MSNQFVAFDVETPNRLNDRISSIGISLIQDDGTVQTKNYFVNPECEFDAFNISLTGITPDLVKNAPCFPSVWSEIEPLFSQHIVVAHNAGFDLAVLQKTLSAYNLEMPQITYLCTFKIAKSVLPNIENHKLSTLSAYFAIPLNHHDSGSDSEACAALLKIFLKAGIRTEKYASVYTSGDFRARGSYKKHPALSDRTFSLRELNAIVKAVSCDGKLAKEEVDYLTGWIRQNASLKGNYPYDRINSKLEEILEDGVISEEEHDELLRLLLTLNDPVNESCSECNTLELYGKNICLSGEFRYGSKNEVTAFLEDRGAQVSSSVTRKTNILIVGDLRSQAWSMVNYGTKIKKARELQEKGIDIQIISEENFFNAIGV